MDSVHLVGGRPAWLRASAVLTLLAAVAFVGGTGDAGARGPVCDLHTLRGTYVFAASGYNIVGGVAQPKAIVELIDFNGDGTLNVSGGTVSINGNVVQNVAGVGVYTLDAECKGTVIFTPGPSFDIFIRPGNKEGRMIQINSGSVFQGTVSRFTP
jgi:hypothetical protein